MRLDPLFETYWERLFAEHWRYAHRQHTLGGVRPADDQELDGTDVPLAAQRK